ncbi:MAG: bifunctional folylpolyglutamate synthase/dihydrofolate synthase [Eggerthellaceae bacterium]|nr:bifunctional folylpolyglutamate synthase/dihydrofolate synthase [Eggerthellaceae bacterium]MDR2715244.1 bifunctional folylpolyglutamate synthase/dihydrofolate synthase [Coriobacteriaceae bacterium]
MKAAGAGQRGEGKDAGGLDPVACFDPVAYINEPRWMASRLGLERIAELLDKIGRPQDRLRFVHVAGTNGKGSFCAFLSRILREAGYRTGLFTSPYIIEFADRIQVDGENIPFEDLCAATCAVKEAAEAMADHPTEFELMTAVAFVHFAQKGCDIVVCEVGLGGRLDSTNIIEAPELCIITAIGLDHTEVLGETLGAIAGEKAGIIKEGVPLLSWPQRPEAMEVVERVARERGAPLALPDFSRLPAPGTASGHSFASIPRASGHQSSPGTAPGYSLSLLGIHQPRNAAMAIKAVSLLRQKGWAISDDALRAGLAKASLPGRFEVVAHSPTFIIDGAHNPDGAQALADSLEAYFPEAAPVFIVGVLKDKDYAEMLRRVLPRASGLVATTPPNDRALPAADLVVCIRSLLEEAGCTPGAVPVHATPDIPAAVRQARALAGPEGLVCAFGSLYSVAPLKSGHSYVSHGTVAIRERPPKSLGKCGQAVLVAGELVAHGDIGHHIIDRGGDKRHPEADVEELDDVEADQPGSPGGKPQPHHDGKHEV